MSLTNKDGDISLGGVVETVQHLEDMSSISLFQYTKRTTVNSRVFIEKTLSGEEILTPLMMNIMNLYAGLILTALNINQRVQGSKKIRDMLSIVSTEGFEDKQAPSMLDERLDAFFQGSTFGNDMTYWKVDPKTGKRVTASPEEENLAKAEVDANVAKRNAEKAQNEVEEAAKRAKREIRDTVKKSKADINDDDSLATSYNGSRLVETEPKDATLPSGRVIEVSFGSDNGSKFTLNLFLQLAQTFIPSDVINQFVGLNFEPSIRQRWLQMSVGEISFWKDFIMSQDIRKARKKALRDDKTGALKDMIDRQENNLSQAWLKLAQVRPDKQNIANTILIFDKNTFNEVANKSGLNVRDFSSRQKFFNASFVMMLVLVDPMYNKVDMYYHGLAASSTFTFDQLKKKSKTDAADLMSIMKNYASGMAPKF
jgi:hypothetical protein